MSLLFCFLYQYHSPKKQTWDLTVQFSRSHICLSFYLFHVVKENIWANVARINLNIMWTECKSKGTAKTLSFFNLSFHSQVLADLLVFAEGHHNSKDLCSRKLPSLFRPYLDGLFKSHVVRPCFLPWACHCCLASFTPVWALSHTELSFATDFTEQQGSSWPRRGANRSFILPWKGASLWSTALSQKACQQPSWR